jgi:benzoate-CoA ligase
VTTQPEVQAPGERFNFAEHLIQRNSQRSSKAAYVDDRGRMSFGELTEQIERAAAALLASGVRREERVLLLMYDCSDWPVGFLGAMYAGIVPVAVNAADRR